MKLVQFYTPELGPGWARCRRTARFPISPLTSPPTFPSTPCWSGLEVSGRAGEDRPAGRARVPAEIEYIYDWEELDRPPTATLPHLMIPLSPPEVWGFGVTYQRSAEVRDADVEKTTDSSESIYDRVYHSARPECFKATAPRCVGPYRPIGIRSDSALTATEPELAYVLGTNREIVGFTICNDVSAWDLEAITLSTCPSRRFTGCCALGPAILTAASGPDPYDLDISCRILRGGEVIYSDSTNSGPHRPALRGAERVSLSRQSHSAGNRGFHRHRYHGSQRVRPARWRHGGDRDRPRSASFPTRRSSSPKDMP